MIQEITLATEHPIGGPAGSGCTPYHSMPLLIRGDVTPTGVGVMSRYKLKICLFLCFSDITSGRVQLDVRWIDQSTGLPSGL